MTTTEIPRKRVRINVSTSVKGIKTYEATFELDEPMTSLGDGSYVDSDTVAKALVESDRLVAELDRRYPAPTA